MLTSIHIYPVKSLGGVDVQAAYVEPWGLRDDRRWLVLNPDGTRGAGSGITRPGSGFA